MNKIIATGEEINAMEADVLVDGGFLKRDKDGDLLIVVEPQDLEALAIKARAEAVNVVTTPPMVAHAFTRDAAIGRARTCP